MLGALSLLLGLAAQTASAPPPATTSTLLVLIEKPSDKAFADQLVRATGAALNNAGLGYIPTPDQPLSEIIFTLGCTDLDSTCAASVGKSLGVTTVVVVQLSQRPCPLVIWSLIDVASTQRVGASALGVSRFDMVGAQQAAAAIGRDLGTPGTLSVNSTPPGATVRVDGQVMGETPVLTAGTLGEGAHSVGLRLPGGMSLEQTVQVRRGEDVRVDVRLDGAEPSSGGGAASIVGWTLVGASALSAVAGGVLGGLAMLAKSRYEAERVVDGITVRQIERSEAKDIQREIETEVLGAEIALGSSLALALGSALVLGLASE
ncbi:MAG: PEGA domain-containing protein [Pseudomonadota bacterium]